MCIRDSFTIVTFTTIGFGDYSPDPHPGWFGSTFIVVCFFGLGVTALLVRAMSDPDFSLSCTLRGLFPHTSDWLRHLSIRLRARMRALSHSARAAQPMLSSFDVDGSVTPDEQPGATELRTR